jgi:hypothetical protein
MMHLSAKDPRAVAQRILSYIFIAIFVSIGTFLLTRYTQGYKLDSDTLKLVQNGLIIVQSKPVKSTISIDGEAQKVTTPSRFTLPIGDHSIKLNADKYRQWQKDFSIVGSDLVWFNYALLVPNNVVTTTYKTFPDAPIIAVSPDKKTIISSTQKPNEFLLTKQDKTIAKDSAIVVPDQPLESVSGFSLANIDFAPDSRHILLVYKKDNIKKYIRTDIRKPENSVYVAPPIKGLFYQDLQFGKSDGSTLYGLEKGDLYKIKFGSELVNTVIAEDILAFNSESDVVSIVQDKENTPERVGAKRLGYINSNGELKYIDEVKTNGPYLLTQAKFKSNLRIALSDGESSLIYSNTQNEVVNKPRVIKIKAEQLSFSYNGRLIALRDGKNIRTLDFEFDKKYQFNLKNNPAGDINWLDDFHITANVNGETELMDYDGTNLQKIVNSSNNIQPFFDADRQFLLTSSINDKIFVINKSLMIVDQ